MKLRDVDVKSSAALFLIGRSECQERSKTAESTSVNSFTAFCPSAFNLLTQPYNLIEIFNFSLNSSFLAVSIMEVASMQQQREAPNGAPPADTSMDIDMDLDLGPLPEPEPIEAVSAKRDFDLLCDRLF